MKLILERSQRKERYSSADFTAHAGIPTFIDAGHMIAHNKVMVIDKTRVIKPFTPSSLLKKVRGMLDKKYITEQ